MAITPDEVRHLHRLAKLALDESRLPAIQAELEAIVGYVQQLQSVDTTGVTPIANVGGLENVTRADVAGAMLPHAAALANAPARNDTAFLVPKAVER